MQVKGEEEKGGFRRFWDSVRGIFTRGEGEEAVEDSSQVHHPGASALLTPECRIVEVGREFRRPIAYDVDYMYRGSKFRTRMDRDPGNRLRIRISISPQPFD